MERRDEDTIERRSGVRRRIVAGVAALALLALGIGVGAWWSDSRATRREARVTGASRAAAPSASPTTSGPTATAKSDEPVEVSLTPEAVRRAGIKTAVVRSEPLTTTLTVPGTVSSNAYRETKVNTLVSGVVRQVRAELGNFVRRGETLAVVLSNELAEAQMKYLAMQAMLGADHQKLERTRTLTAIGAASRQELEEITAVHEGHTAEMAATRQRLVLLGMSADQVGRLRDASHVVSEVTVTAPADGIVLTRAVNAGQVIGTGQELFVVADLSTVWVLGDVYEKDFPALEVGAATSVTLPGAPERSIRGRVAYIDPRVDPAARTAKVRIEVPNPKGELRLGMFVQVKIAGAGGDTMRIVVPRAALQSIGGRTVVYVPGDDEGRFTERTVKTGAVADDMVEVLEGLKPGGRVVTDGSFLLRAEAARLRSGG